MIHIWPYPWPKFSPAEESGLCLFRKQVSEVYFWGKGMDGWEISLLPGADKKQSKNTQSMKGSVQVTLPRERTQDGNKRSNSTAAPFRSSLTASLHFSYFMETSIPHLGGAPGPRLDTFSVVTFWRRGSYGHLASRDRGAAKLPTVLRTVPTTKSNLAPKVSSAETEKPRHGGWTGACIEELWWG